MEKTLILIKPDAIEKRLTGVILDRIESLGLQLASAKVAVVTEKLAREHYANLAGTPFVDNVVKFMMGNFNNIENRRVYAFVYKGEDAIAKVRHIIGVTDPDKADPWTIRGQFGQKKNGVIQNCVHASGSQEDAEREIALWFKPEEIVE
ncbi:Nucleoside-diphosphate kinase [Elusimicrobium minutum Pei191]|uniref:nucleoside-diphosphate kinase n=1 Tax=Elusimicrobium minutum (strain Pei191) TaxID=445932 RepID=B2KEX8_ELUMP|nr:nucleoside-diphosphate kinase [Elusimicrobium minutum]ACC99074.1 Nucleoside-diphosphate kinase [Elusimicrobium minutum Pei191]